MEVRDKLGPETDYEQARIDVANLNGVAVILTDGEVLTKSESRQSQFDINIARI